MKKKRILPVLLFFILMVSLIGTVKSCVSTEAVFGGNSLSRDFNGGIPLFLQKDKRWGKEDYGNSTIEISGCGPTCLSMVYCGLTGDMSWTPSEVAAMAEKKGYYVKGVGTSWELMTAGAEELGIHGEELSLDENSIRNALKEEHPIICAVGPGDFTTEGHFIVLVGLTEDGKLMVNDPNSQKNSERTWDLERVMGQIKNLWVYE